MYFSNLHILVYVIANILNYTSRGVPPSKTSGFCNGENCPNCPTCGSFFQRQTYIRLRTSIRHTNLTKRITSITRSDINNCACGVSYP